MGVRIHLAGRLKSEKICDSHGIGLMHRRLQLTYCHPVQSVEPDSRNQERLGKFE